MARAEEAYKAGKARAIGVSNFYPDRFMDLALFSEIKLFMNHEDAAQIESFFARFGVK